jgi:cobalamin biosynthesis Mg chelatase CobN
MVEEIISGIGALVVAIFTGIFVYNYQQNRKRQTQLAERRKDLYEELIRKLIELIVARTGADRSLLLSEIEKSWLFASDAVLQTIYDYLEKFDQYYEKSGGNILAEIQTNDDSRDDMANILAKIFLAMRKDISRIRPTAIDEEWIETHVKVYKWGVIANEPELTD